MVNSSILSRLEAGGALLPDTPNNTLEVVGVLKSYGLVLDGYWRTLRYIAEEQFLELFPFFKYLNGEVTSQRLLNHWSHDRLNFEFAEYCMKAMFWHGGGGLDRYLDSEDFQQRVSQVVQAKANPVIQGLGWVFPNFLSEQVRQSVYYSALGQFWQVMSPMFLTLSDRYDQGEITCIADVVDHVRDGLVAAAGNPFTYEVKVRDKVYELVPASANLSFLMDLAVPYVEAVFLKSLPFMGTVSYNAQARQIPASPDEFSYGALFADPLPIGGAGIPPTLLMQDMARFVPDYLRTFYEMSFRGTADLRVQLCVSFQKSMFCVTTAAIQGLAPYPIPNLDPVAQAANRHYLNDWLTRLAPSRLSRVNE